MRGKGAIARDRHDTLDAALEAAERHAERAALTPRLETVDLRVREYGPEAQVTARVEVSGPGRIVPAVRAGLDVQGDGSITAWTGRVQRAAVEPVEGETPAQALRRELATS